VHIDKDQNRILATFLLKTAKKEPKKKFDWIENKYQEVKKEKPNPPNWKLLNFSAVQFLLNKSRTTKSKKKFLSKLFGYASRTSYIFHIVKLLRKIQEYRNRLEKRAKKEGARKVYHHSCEMPWFGFTLLLSLDSLFSLNVSNSSDMQEEKIMDLFRIHEFLGGLKTISLTNVNDYSSIVLDFETAYPWTGIVEVMFRIQMKLEIKAEDLNIEEYGVVMEESVNNSEKIMYETDQEAKMEAEANPMFKDGVDEKAYEEYLDQLEKTGQL